MKRKIVDKKILDELLDAVKEAGRKDNRAALNALDYCAEICDETSSETLKNILLGKSEFVLDYIKACGGDPLFKSGNKKFELVWKDDQYVLEEFNEKILYDDWGNKIDIDAIARLSYQAFTDVRDKSTVYKVFAFYRDGSKDVLGIFTDKNEFNAYYKKVLDAFNL